MHASRTLSGGETKSIVGEPYPEMLSAAPYEDKTEIHWRCQGPGDYQTAPGARHSVDCTAAGDSFSRAFAIESFSRYKVRFLQ